MMKRFENNCIKICSPRHNITSYTLLDNNSAPVHSEVAKLVPRLLPNDNVQLRRISMS